MIADGCMVWISVNIQSYIIQLKCDKLKIIYKIFTGSFLLSFFEWKL